MSSSRQQAYLRQRYRAFVGYIGALIYILGFVQLVPLLLIPFFPDEWRLSGAFLITGLPLIVSGMILRRRYMPEQTLSLTMPEGSVVVLIVWLAALFSSSVPFMLIGGLNLSQACFEAISGWTTTGLTVVDVSQAPNLLLFYRSLTQFSGGAGFVIIALSAVAGTFGMNIAAAEGRNDQLAPHIRKSASIVLQMYAGYAIFGIVALTLAGMSPFDAVNHAFTAISTAGFSTRPESIAYWDSFSIEVVTMILMILGATNFFIAYTFLRGKFVPVWKSAELRLLIFLLVSVTALLTVFVTHATEPDAGRSIRAALFNAVSALTTTGFSTVDYRPWADFGWMILILLMLIGGGAGSTAGGIKLMRVYIIYKAIIWEIRRSFMPPHMVNEPAIWQGERRELMNDRWVRQTALFVGIYVGFFLLGSGIMTLHGYSMKESFFEFASALGGVGVSVGVTQPSTPPLVLWTMNVGMFLGRLEFFTIIVGVLKIISDAREMALPPST
ncbi:MAG: potassium transporter TrkG [Anaerolineae bacterium]|nr:potassium transporter TrkG [Anaerolineae bacterium]